MSDIDWKVVSQNLVCPQCGEPAHIAAESDGTEGYHQHRFKISREDARALTRKFGKPTYEELEAENKELRAQLNHDS